MVVRGGDHGTIPMPDARKRPCSICRHWFRPDPRVGARQRACSKPECQAARRKKTQARWRAAAANRGYARANRILKRNAAESPPEPVRVPAPLHRLPWDVAKDQFGAKGADFIGVLSILLLRTAKDQFRAHRIDPTRVPGTLPLAPAKDQIRPAPY
jgi:hypothetical protein